MAQGDGFALFDQKMADEVGNQGGDGAGSIWDIISQLLPILIPLIAGCFGGGTATHKPGRFGNRGLVAVLVHRKTGCTWTVAFQVADYAFNALDKSTLPEFQLFVSDCCATKAA